MKRTALAVSVAMGALALAGCGGGAGSAAAAAPGGIDVNVMFVLTDGNTAYSQCKGDGGYSDIGSGTPVQITNQSGDILGAENLGTGTPAGVVCTWRVKFSGVPKDAKFYSVEVGSRGKITKSAADLKSDDYQFKVSLGS